MAEYVLSNRADEDLRDIYLYSYQQFGEAQADAYLLALDERCSHLAEQPQLGRKIDYIRVGYYRYEHVSHTIFYKATNKGIFVVRILHNKMDIERHL